LMRGRSTSPSQSRSQSRSPSPDFARLDAQSESRTFNSVNQMQNHSHKQRDNTMKVSQSRFNENIDMNADANIDVPLTPNTRVPTRWPLPLTHLSNNDSSSSLRPLVPPISSQQQRSPSQERRRELNLSVKTSFDSTSTSTKGPEKRKEKIHRKPVDEEHWILRRMFPAN
jgi:hypothetical protein